MDDDVQSRLDAMEDRLVALEGDRIRPPLSAIDPDLLYNARDVAAWLRCGLVNVYQLTKQGMLASVRTAAGGGGLRIRGADLITFLGERRRAGPPAKNEPTTLKYIKV